MKKIVRIIASILVVTFLFQDIAWANPDTLAPRSFFQQEETKKRAKSAAVELLMQKHANAGKNGFSPNTSFGKGVALRHNRVNLIIGVSPKKILQLGQYYKRMPGEEKLEVDTNCANAKLIQEAEKCPRKSTVGIDKETLGRAQRMPKNLTVIEVDLPSHFLIHGRDVADNIYWQLTHIGKTQGRVYIPKKFLELLDINSRADMECLFTILNHDEFEVEKIWEMNLDKEGITAEYIEDAHDKAMACDPFNRYNDIEMRFGTIYEPTDEMIGKEIPGLRKEIARIHLERRALDIAKSTDTKEAAMLDFELGRLCIKLGCYYDIVEDRKNAITFYVRAVGHLRKVSYKDSAMLPILAQERIVYLYAREMMTADLLREIDKFTSYDAFRSDSLQYISEEDQGYERSFFNNEMTRWRFQRMKDQVISILDHHINNEDYVAERDVLLEAKKHVEAMRYGGYGIGWRGFISSISRKFLKWMERVKHFLKNLYRDEKGMIEIDPVGAISRVIEILRGLVLKAAKPQDEIIYEINTRALGKRFSEITDEELTELRDTYGATVLWLMGIWQTSPYSKAANDYWRNKNNEPLERAASAYAIIDYAIAEDLGGEKEFRNLVRRANRLGLKVMLDVVPNHMAVNSPLFKEHPEYFMSLSSNLSENEAKLWIEGNRPRLKLKPENTPNPVFQADTYGVEDSAIPEPTSQNVFYYGRDTQYKDGKGLSWIDTVQFNYTKAAMREYMRSVLFKVAALANGGGIRLDMLFLTTKNYIRWNWFSHLSDEEFNKLYPEEEFWKTVIHELKEKYPNFVVLAEMYGSHEHAGLAKELAIDYYYEDYFLKCMVGRDVRGLKNFLQDCIKDSGRKNYVKYLENHDSEDRIINLLKHAMGEKDALPASLAVSTLLYTLPGGALIYSGQEKGHSAWISKANIIRGPPQQDNQQVIDQYKALGSIASNKLHRDIFRYGSFKLLDIGNPDTVIAFEREYNGKKVVVVINYCNYFTGNIKVPVEGREEEIDLPPWGTKIYLPIPAPSIFSLEGFSITYFAKSLSFLAAFIGGFAGLAVGMVHISDKPPIKETAKYWWQEKKLRGILSPLFSLRREGDDGVGDLACLDKFIDYLAHEDYDMAFLLPTNQTSRTDPSPYNSISLFANNAIMYLPLDELVSKERYSEYVDSFAAAQTDLKLKLKDSKSAQRVDHPLVYAFKEYVLRQEFEKFYSDYTADAKTEDSARFRNYLNNYEFREEIDNYALFHTLLDHHKGKYWREWEEKYRDPKNPGNRKAIEQFKNEHAKDILFYKYAQWLYYVRSLKTKKHADGLNKFLIGDLPIYPSKNSADVWANQEMFNLEKNAGAPADQFKADGQNWGLPAYRWEEKRREVLDFWKRRILYAAQFYHGVRVDHLLGLCSEWLIDEGEKATEGKFYPASPDDMEKSGRETVTELASAALACNVLLIGEDLGERPENVRKMLDELSLKLPNLYLYNVIGWRELGIAARSHILTVSETHDTEPTFAARFEKFSDKERRETIGFAHTHGISISERESPESAEEKIYQAVDKSDFSCRSIQGKLKVSPKTSRINEPGKVHDKNWNWRMPQTLESLLTKEPTSIAAEIKDKGALIYLLNARDKLQGGKRFDDITDAELAKLKEQGFNVLWMMGIWKTGEFTEKFNKMWDEKRVGSAYSIYDYVINSELGDEASFRRFVSRANRAGIKVTIDFMPNQMAVDSAWVREHPEWFVRSDNYADEAGVLNDYLIGSEEFGKRRLGERRYFIMTDAEGRQHKIAHAIELFHQGPYIDCAQLDFTNPEVIIKLNDVMDYILDLTNGGGIRIDTIPAVTRDQFFKIWHKDMGEDFWPLSFQHLRDKYPSAFFIAETYNMGEEQFQVYGADFVYDCKPYDLLIKQKTATGAAIAEYFVRPPSSTFDPAKMLHFIETQDDPSENYVPYRVASLINSAQHKAAAVILMAGAAGGVMIHDGQMEGKTKEKGSAIYATRHPEDETHDPELLRFYEELIARTKNPLFRYGKTEKVPGDGIPDNFFCVRRSHNGQEALVVVNWSDKDSDFNYNKFSQHFKPWEYKIIPLEKDPAEMWRGVLQRVETLSPDQLWQSCEQRLPKETQAYQEGLSIQEDAPMLVSINARLFKSFDDIGKELESLREMGIKHLYLLGAFKESEISRKQSQGEMDDDIHHFYYDRDEEGHVISVVKNFCPKNEDFVASAFSIPDLFQPSPGLGGWEGFRRLLKKAGELKIGISLDLLAHSTSVDGKWLRDERLQEGDNYWYVHKDISPEDQARLSNLNKVSDLPEKNDTRDWKQAHIELVELFDRILSNNPGYFLHCSTKLNRWILVAHGTEAAMRNRGDYWFDMALLDVSNPDVRCALIDTAVKYAREGVEGFRCDCAMTTVKEGGWGFLDMWWNHEHLVGPRDINRYWPRELWEELIHAVRSVNPNALFTAEAYWLFDVLERCGFNYISQTHVFNLLNKGEIQRLKEYLMKEHINEQFRRAYSIISHDDEPFFIKRYGEYPRAVSQVLRNQFLAIATMPGMPIVLFEQIKGYFARATAKWYRLPSVDRPRTQIRDLFREIISIARDPLLRLGQLFVFNTPNPRLISFSRYDKEGTNGGRRAVVVVGNYSNWEVESQIPLREAAMQLGISAEPSKYFAFTDRLTGEVYLRSGRELYDRGLYVSLPGNSYHLFMVQEMNLPDGKYKGLAGIHGRSNGNGLSVEDIVVLMRDFGLKLDFPCSGRASKAAALRMLTERLPLSEVEEVLRNANVCAGEISFRDGQDPARQIDALRRQYPDDEKIERFCKVLEAAHKFFAPLVRDKVVHFTITRAESSSRQVGNDLYIELGSSPIWDIESTEGRQTIGMDMRIVDSAYKNRTAESASSVLTALFSLFDRQVHDFIVKEMEERYSPLSVGGEVEYFYMYGGPGKAIDVLKKLLGSKYSQDQADAIDMAVSFRDEAIESELYAFVASPDDRADRIYPQRRIIARLAQGGTPAGKARVRDYIMSELRKSESVTTALMAVEGASYFNDKEILELLLGQSAAFPKETLTSLKNIIHRNKEIVSHLCQGLEARDFYQQVVVIKALADLVKLGSVEGVQKKEFTDALTRTLLQVQSYFLLFHIRNAYEQIGDNGAEAMICAKILKRDDIPWITSVVFADVVPGGRITGSDIAIKMPDSQKNFFRNAFIDTAKFMRGLWRLVVVRESELGAPNSAFMTFIEEMKVCERDTGNRDTSSNIMYTMISAWTHRYSHLKKKFDVSKEEMREIEGKLIGSMASYPDYWRSAFDPMTEFGDNYEGTDELTPSKQERMDFLALFLPVNMGKRGFNSFSAALGIRAIRSLYSLGAFKYWSDKTSPKEDILYILRSRNVDQTMVLRYSDDRGDIPIVIFILNELEKLVSLGFELDKEIRRALMDVAFDMWHPRRYADEILAFLKRVDKLPKDERPRGVGAAYKGDAAFNEGNASLSSLIAGQGLKPDATQAEINKVIIDAVNDPKANNDLLRILGFSGKERKALWEDKGNLFRKAGKFEAVEDIRCRDIKKVRNKARLSIKCQNDYKHEFAKFVALSYSITKDDTEDAVNKKIDKVFGEYRPSLRNVEFLGKMAEYFENYPDALLSLVYIVWVEIRAGPRDEAKPLIDILIKLSRINRGWMLSYYKLAAIRYLDRLGVKKDVRGILPILAKRPPKELQLKEASYRSIVDLAREGSLKNFYAFIKPEVSAPLAALAIKAVAEARPDTKDLEKFLDAASRHPGVEVQEAVKTARLPRPLMPEFFVIPAIKGFPHPEYMKKISQRRRKTLEAHLMFPDGMVSTNISPWGTGPNKEIAPYLEDGYLFGYIACHKAMRLWGESVLTENVGRSIFNSVYEAVSDVHKHGGLGSTIDIKMLKNGLLEVVCESYHPSGTIEDPDKFNNITEAADECTIESHYKKWVKQPDGILKHVDSSKKGSGAIVILRWHKPETKSVLEDIDVPWRAIGLIGIIITTAALYLYTRDSTFLAVTVATAVEFNKPGRSLKDPEIDMAEVSRNKKKIAALIKELKEYPSTHIRKYLIAARIAEYILSCPSIPTDEEISSAVNFNINTITNRWVLAMRVLTQPDKVGEEVRALLDAVKKKEQATEEEFDDIEIGARRAARMNKGYRGPLYPKGNIEKNKTLLIRLEEEVENFRKAIAETQPEAAVTVFGELLKRIPDLKAKFETVKNEGGEREPDLYSSIQEEAFRKLLELLSNREAEFGAMKDMDVPDVDIYIRRTSLLMKDLYHIYEVYLEHAEKVTIEEREEDLNIPVPAGISQDELERWLALTYLHGEDSEENLYELIRSVQNRPKQFGEESGMAEEKAARYASNLRRLEFLMFSSPERLGSTLSDLARSIYPHYKKAMVKFYDNPDGRRFFDELHIEKPTFIAIGEEDFRIPEKRGIENNSRALSAKIQGRKLWFVMILPDGIAEKDKIEKKIGKKIVYQGQERELGRKKAEELYSKYKNSEPERYEELVTAASRGYIIPMLVRAGRYDLPVDKVYLSTTAAEVLKNSLTVIGKAKLAQVLTELMNKLAAQNRKSDQGTKGMAGGLPFIGFHNRERGVVGWAGSLLRAFMPTISLLFAEHGDVPSREPSQQPEESDDFVLSEGTKDISDGGTASWEDMAVQSLKDMGFSGEPMLSIFLTNRLELSMQLFLALSEYQAVNPNMTLERFLHYLDEAHKGSAASSLESNYQKIQAGVHGLLTCPAEEMFNFNISISGIGREEMEEFVKRHLGDTLPDPEHILFGDVLKAFLKVHESVDQGHGRLQATAGYRMIDRLYESFRAPGDKGALNVMWRIFGDFTTYDTDLIRLYLTVGQSETFAGFLRELHASDPAETQNAPSKDEPDSVFSESFAMPDEIKDSGHVLRVIFENENNARKFLRLASRLRERYPYTISVDDPRFPLKYALENKIFFKIGPDLYLTPVTESFRRHIIFKMMPDATVKFAVEVVMSGKRGDRKEIGLVRAEIAEEIEKKFHGCGYCVKPVYVKDDFPEGAYELYGGTMNFTRAAPLRVIAFEYYDEEKHIMNDGKRLSNVSREMLDDISRRRGEPPDELYKRIIRQAAELVASTHALGYLGHDFANNDHHIENMRLVLREGTSPAVIWVGDFTAFEKETALRDAGDARKKDIDTVIDGIPSRGRPDEPGGRGVRGLANIIPFEKYRIYNIFIQHYGECLKTMRERLSLLANTPAPAPSVSARTSTRLSLLLYSSIALTAAFAIAANLWWPSILTTFPYWVNTTFYFGMGELLSQIFNHLRDRNEKFDKKKIAIAAFLYGSLFGVIWELFYSSYIAFIPNTGETGKWFRVFVDQAAGATASVFWTFLVSGLYDKLPVQSSESRGSIFTRLTSTTAEIWKERKENFLKAVLWCWAIWIPIQYFNLNSAKGPGEMVSAISIVEMPWSIYWVILANSKSSEKNHEILPRTILGFGLGTFIGYFVYYIVYIHSMFGNTSPSWLAAIPLFSLLGAAAPNLNLSSSAPQQPPNYSSLRDSSSGQAHEALEKGSGVSSQGQGESSASVSQRETGASQDDVSGDTSKTHESLYAKLDARARHSVNRVNSHNDAVVAKILAAFLLGASRKDTINSLAAYFRDNYIDDGDDYAASDIAARRTVDRLTEPIAMAADMSDEQAPAEGSEVSDLFIKEVPQLVEAIHKAGAKNLTLKNLAYHSVNAALRQWFRSFKVEIKKTALEKSADGTIYIKTPDGLPIVLAKETDEGFEWLLKDKGQARQLIDMLLPAPAAPQPPRASTSGTGDRVFPQATDKLSPDKASAKTQPTEKLTQENFNRYVIQNDGLVSLEGISRHFGIERRRGMRLSSVRRAFKAVVDIDAVMAKARQGNKALIPIIIQREIKLERLKKVLDFMEKSGGAVTIKQITEAVGIEVRVGLNRKDVFGKVEYLYGIASLDQLFTDLNHNQRLLGRPEISIVNAYDQIAEQNKRKVIAALEKLNGMASSEELAAALNLKTTNPKSAPAMAYQMFNSLDIKAINKERKAEGMFPFHPELINGRTKKAWNAIVAHLEGRAGISTVHEIALDLGWTEMNVYNLARKIDWNYINKVRESKGLFLLGVFYKREVGDARRDRPLRITGNGLNGIRKGDEMYGILIQGRRYFEKQHDEVGYRSYRLCTIPPLYARFKQIYYARRNEGDKNDALCFVQDILTLIINNVPAGKIQIHNNHSGAIPRKESVNYYFQVDVPRAINISTKAFELLDVETFEANLQKIMAHDFPLNGEISPERASPISGDKPNGRKPVMPKARRARPGSPDYDKGKPENGSRIPELKVGEARAASLPVTIPAVKVANPVFGRARNLPLPDPIFNEIDRLPSQRVSKDEILRRYEAYELVHERLQEKNGGMMSFLRSLIDQDLIGHAITLVKMLGENYRERGIEPPTQFRNEVHALSRMTASGSDVSSRSVSREKHEAPQQPPNYSSLRDSSSGQAQEAPEIKITVTKARQNPILEPREVAGHEWEKYHVLNPGAFYYKGRYYILYRACGEGPDRIGLAISDDGVTITKRLDSWILGPDDTIPEESGCEDPRVTIIDDTLYLVYTAVTKIGGRQFFQPAVAGIPISRFMSNVENPQSANWKWEKALPFEDNHILDKNAALFPEKINGRYAMLHRQISDNGAYKGIQIAYSDKIKGPYIDVQEIVTVRRDKWDSHHIGIAAPPIKTEAGWLLLYHGAEENNVYRVGYAILDINDPTKVLYRSEEPLIEPTEDYEKHGRPGEKIWIANVVFPCSAVIKGGCDILHSGDTFFVYYGAADHTIAQAECVFTDKTSNPESATPAALNHSQDLDESSDSGQAPQPQEAPPEGDRVAPKGPSPVSPDRMAPQAHKRGVGAAAAAEELHHEEADELRTMLNKLCGKVGLTIPSDDEVRNFMSYAVKIGISPRGLAIALDELPIEYDIETNDHLYYILKTALNREYQPDAKLPHEISKGLQSLVALISEICSSQEIRDGLSLVEPVSEIQTVVVKLGILSHGISMVRVFPYRQDYWDRAISQAKQALAACNLGSIGQPDVDRAMADARLVTVRQSLRNIVETLKTVRSATFSNEISNVESNPVVAGTRTNLASDLSPAPVAPQQPSSEITLEKMGQSPPLPNNGPGTVPIFSSVPLTAQPFTEPGEVLPAVAIDYVKELKAKITFGIENLVPIAEVQQDMKGKALILFADDILERGAVIDLKQTLVKTNKLDGSTMIIYEKRAGCGAILKQIIDGSNKGVNVIIVDEAGLSSIAQKEDTRVNEASALEALIRYAVPKVGSGNVVGVIKGRRPDEDLASQDSIEEVLARLKTPVVNFETDNGVYSFAEALNILIAVKKSAEAGEKAIEWYRKLPPINRADIQKIYDEYKALLEPALSA